MKPYLKKTHHKKGLVEWLKGVVQTPVLQKKKKKKPKAKRDMAQVAQCLSSNHKALSVYSSIKKKKKKV
jgi:hypothetical protein